MSGAPIASKESVRARALQLCTVRLQAGASAAALGGRLQPSRCFVRRRAWPRAIARGLVQCTQASLSPSCALPRPSASLRMRVCVCFGNTQTFPIHNAYLAVQRVWSFEVFAVTISSPC